MNLIERIQQAINTDDDDWDEQSSLLLDIWAECTPEQRKLIDAVMTCVCGWRLQSLIDGEV